MLAPVVIVTDQDNLRIVREEFVVRAGVNDILSNISQERSGIRPAQLVSTRATEPSTRNPACMQVPVVPCCTGPPSPAILSITV